jgi:hypothetical protein
MDLFKYIAYGTMCQNKFVYSYEENADARMKEFKS